MNLKKFAAFSLIPITFRAIAILVTNKVVALYVGPSGLALMAQFQNISQLALTVAQGGINAGVTKYTAEYESQQKPKESLFSTAVMVVLCCSIFVASVFWLFSDEIILKIKLEDDYNYVLRLFAILIIFGALNALLISIINGLQEKELWIKINIIHSICSGVISVVLTLLYGIEGMLIALVIIPVLMFFITLMAVRKKKLINFKQFTSKFKEYELKKLSAYTIMALTSAVAVHFSHLYMRTALISEMGMDAAGNWQGMIFISTMNLYIFTTALSVYYLPKLASMSNPAAIGLEIRNANKTILPIVLTSSFFLYVCREQLTQLLFSGNFGEMEDLFLYQLIGDVIKIMCWIRAYIMIAKAMTGAYITTEVAFSLLLVVISMLSMREFGLVGMSYSYAITYSIYYIAVNFITRRY